MYEHGFTYNVIRHTQKHKGDKSCPFAGWHRYYVVQWVGEGESRGTFLGGGGWNGEKLRLGMGHILPPAPGPQSSARAS